MDAVRLQFLFGADALEHLGELDLADEADVMEAIERFAPLSPDTTDRDLRTALRTVAVSQILANDPPETWETVQRLSNAGLERDAILSELAMIIGERLRRTMASKTDFDKESYVKALNRLPLPRVETIARDLIEKTRADPGISSGDLLAATIDSIGGQDGAAETQLVNRVFDELLYGPLCLLPPDRTVVIPDILDGITFTHRLTDAEAELGLLSIGFDFGALCRFELVRLEDGTELDQFSAEAYHQEWRGPQGWLERFKPGDLLACTASLYRDVGEMNGPIEVIVTIELLSDEPGAASASVDSVRAGYNEFIGEFGLPIDGPDLAVWLLFHRSKMFASPQLPLGELCAAAGLEQRGGLVADSEEVWREELTQRRVSLMRNTVPEQRWSLTIANAIQVLDDPNASIEAVRTALSSCAEPEALTVLADAFFGHYLDANDQFEMDYAEATGRLFEIVERATTLASGPRQIATAHYLSSILYERCGDPETAELHIKRASEAQPLLSPIAERMGRACFDRGDAAGAMRWWRKLPSLPEGALTIKPFLSPGATGPKIGRNDPCWCGSERKFKRCHLGSDKLPALPDRVGWLCRKATDWLAATTGEVRETVEDTIWCYAAGSMEQGSFAEDSPAMRDRIDAAVKDPIVLDAALTEGGLFSLFLYERGGLLPEDEQILAASWQTIDRSVHEVVAVNPGEGLTVRDLATGEVLEVRERTASHQMAVGERYCTRVVPDGESHQIIGGMFPVRTGLEEAVLELCQTGDPDELCAWAGALTQPPKITSRPGMIEEMFDKEAIEATLAAAGDLDSDDALVLVQAEMNRQSQARWLDEHVPALGGMTPREAAADPTRREQLERLLAEFDKPPTAPLPEGLTPFTYDVDALRRELGLK